MVQIINYLWRNIEIVIGAVLVSILASASLGATDVSQQTSNQLYLQTTPSSSLSTPEVTSQK